MSDDTARPPADDFQQIVDFYLHHGWEIVERQDNPPAVLMRRIAAAMHSGVIMRPHVVRRELLRRVWVDEAGTVQQAYVRHDAWEEEATP